MPSSNKVTTQCPLETYRCHALMHKPDVNSSFRRGSAMLLPVQFWKMINPENVVYMYPCRKEARFSNISQTWSPGSRLRMATVDADPQNGMLSAHTVATMFPFFRSITPACNREAMDALLWINIGEQECRFMR